MRSEAFSAVDLSFPWFAGALVQGERAVSSALSGAQLPPPLADLLRGRAPPQAGAPAGGPAPPARDSAPVPAQQRYRALAFLAHRGGAVATAGAPRPPDTGSAGGGGSGGGLEGGLSGASRLEFDGASGSVTVPGGARGSGPAAGAPPGAEAAGSSAANCAAEPAAVRGSSPESPVAAAAAAAAGAADMIARGAQGLQAAAGRAADPNPSSDAATPHEADLAAASLPAGAAGSTLEAGQPGGGSTAEEEAKFGVASAFAARAAGTAGAGAATFGAGGAAGQMSAPLASPAQQLKQVPPCAVGGLCFTACSLQTDGFSLLSGYTDVVSPS